MIKQLLHLSTALPLSELVAHAELGGPAVGLGAGVGANLLSPQVIQLLVLEGVVVDGGVFA